MIHHGVTDASSGAFPAVPSSPSEADLQADLGSAHNSGARVGLVYVDIALTLILFFVVLIWWNTAGRR